MNLEEWTQVDDVRKFLAPFKKLSEKMSSESKVTSAQVIVSFNTVFDFVERVATRQGMNASIQAASNSIHEKFVKYYSKTNVTTMLCTFLHPSHKLRYFMQDGNQFLKSEMDELKSQ